MKQKHFHTRSLQSTHLNQNTRMTKEDFLFLFNKILTHMAQVQYLLPKILPVESLLLSCVEINSLNAKNSLTPSIHKIDSKNETSFGRVFFQSSFSSIIYTLFTYELCSKQKTEKYLIECDCGWVCDICCAVSIVDNDAYSNVYWRERSESCYCFDSNEIERNWLAVDDHWHIKYKIMTFSIKFRFKFFGN